METVSHQGINPIPWALKRADFVHPMPPFATLLEVYWLAWFNHYITLSWPALSFRLPSLSPYITLWFPVLSPFTISSNVFHTQEWSTLARDNILCMRKTLPLVRFFWLVGWLVGIVTSGLKMETACFSEMLASTSQSTQCLNPEHHHYFTRYLHLILYLTKSWWIPISGLYKKSRWKWCVELLKVPQFTMAVFKKYYDDMLLKNRIRTGYGTITTHTVGYGS
jgi:hypothetical protein